VGHLDEVFAVDFSPIRKILASTSKDKKVKLWNIDTGKEIQSFSLNSLEIYSIAFSPDGKILACGTNDATISLIPLTT
jgi:WD40 repeat protein